MTRTNRLRLIALVAAAGTLASGCESTGGLSDEGAGVALGALVGCGIGAAITGRAEGCAWGAAAGAALGYTAVKISQYESRQVRSAKADQRIYGLTPATDSAQVKIRKGRSAPKTVKPGQSVDFVTDYSLVLPKGQDGVRVDESWVLKKDGQVVWKPSPKKNQVGSGGYSANMTIELPPDIPAGKYTVVHRVQAGKSYDEKETTFTVRS